MSKFCPKCKIIKQFSDFYRCKKRKDGLRAWCKYCEKIENGKREPSYNTLRKKYREDHKEENSIKKKKYYTENKDYILQLGKTWRKTTINGRWNSYVRSAKKRNFSWNITKEEFESFWGKPCNYCGCEISTIGLDRIDSSKGYEITNLISCCTQCNIIKLDYSYEEFIIKINKIYKHLKLWENSIVLKET